MIKTTKAMRDLYAKHLNKLYDYADGRFADPICYMCNADSLALGECASCPLSQRLNNNIFCPKLRKINLKSAMENPTYRYQYATPASIRKHARWIERQIVKHTDCEFNWEKE